MQVIEPTHIGRYLPSKESQADKGIDHPVIACNTCNIAWRSYTPMQCPICPRGVGAYFILYENEIVELMNAVSYLEEDVLFHAETERVTWKFRNLLKQHTTWYKMNSRVIIQACYMTLRQKDWNPKVAYAIEFFMSEYAAAPEDVFMYTPIKSDDYTISMDTLQSGW
jgi:hypothetical protein